MGQGEPVDGSATAHLRLYEAGETTVELDVSETFASVVLLDFEVSDVGEVMIAYQPSGSDDLVLELRGADGELSWTRNLGALGDQPLPTLGFVSGGEALLVAGPDRIHGLSIER